MEDRPCYTTVKKSSKGRGEAFRDGHDGLKGLKWPRRRPATAFSDHWPALTPRTPGKIACSAFCAVGFLAEQLMRTAGQPLAHGGRLDAGRMPAGESEHDRRITAREGSVSGAWRSNSSASTHEIGLILANLPIFPGLEPFEARADAPDSSIGGFSRRTAAEVATDLLPPPARRRHAEGKGDGGRSRPALRLLRLLLFAVKYNIQQQTTQSTERSLSWQAKRSSRKN